MVMVHGRGATAENILLLFPELRHPELACVAPQAAGGSWYPASFLAPMESNEPGLSSALARLGEVLAELAAAGIPPERTILFGFSQGACLSLEFAARNARRYGALVGLSGGLIGPPGTPGITRDRWPARRSSSAAATAIRISPVSGWTRPPRCCGGWAAR